MRPLLATIRSSFAQTRSNYRAFASHIVIMIVNDIVWPRTVRSSRSVEAAAAAPQPSQRPVSTNSALSSTTLEP